MGQEGHRWPWIAHMISICKTFNNPLGGDNFDTKHTYNKPNKGPRNVDTCIISHLNVLMFSLIEDHFIILSSRNYERDIIQTERYDSNPSLF